MADGYIKTRPDVKWWTAQIIAGRDYRKKWTMETEWDRWRDYYRGRWTSRVMPVNMFFTMLRSTVPRVYFRNPTVNVSPGQPGFLSMAFAQLLGRLDHKVLAEINIKREMKRMVHDAWLKGTAFGKLGYGSAYSPGGMGQEAPVGARGERFEYDYDVLPKFPWFKRACASSVILPDGLFGFEEARWYAHEVTRPKDDVIRDPRFKGASDVPPSAWSIKSTNVELAHRVEMIDLLEVHDKKYGMVFVMAPLAKGDGKILHLGPDELGARRPNIFPLVFNPDDEICWGVPDACILEPPQLELNEINTQIMKHRRLSLIKLLYKRGAITKEQLDNMTSEDVGAGVEIEGSLNEVDSTVVGDIPIALINAKSLTIQDIRDQTGFGRNQMGDYQSRRGDTSATEAAVVAQGSEVRVDERRDALADVLYEMVLEMHELMFAKWTAREVFELVGPGGVPVWVEASPSALGLARYKTKIDPDSGQHISREAREQRAIGLYQLLASNPLIDPFKLTNMLLSELEGFQLDDLMRQMPAIPGFAGGRLNPAAYGDLLQDGFRQLRISGPLRPAQVEG
jgi:hypothetical protein